MQQKNFFIAMGLIMGFLFLWSTFVIPRYAPAPKPVPAPIQNDAVAERVPLQTEIASAHKRMGQPLVLKDTILRDQNNEIVLTSEGGAVKHWRLKVGNREVDMVLSPEADVLPLATFADSAFDLKLAKTSAIMQATLSNGLRLTKTLELNPAGYLHKVTFRFSNPSSRAITLPEWTWGWGPGLGTDPGEMKENPAVTRAIHLIKEKANKIKENERKPAGQWAGIDNRYYLTAFLPESGHTAEAQAQGAKDKTQLVLFEKTVVPARGTTTFAYDLYVGPKGYTQLKKYDRKLENSVDFGWFTSIGRLILSALYFLKAHTGNYGVAIILLTMCLQLLLLPLTLKSFKVTLAMKKIQPQIAEIQARYKGDPKRLNIEMMNIYKNSKTNPFGGCLPMVVQMPVFIALFNALRNAYELRGAPFVGWIHDLSAPDVLFSVAGFPLHLLPLIMGVGMFFQQRMSGAIADPTQRQMMTIMPIMFTVMFYGFPSGLVLYWLTNNLMTMLTQWIFQRTTQTPSRVVETTIVR